MKAWLKVLVAHILGLVRRPLGSVRLRRATRRRHDLKINLGAGYGTLPGWLNTDIHWRTQYYLDAARHWPLDDGSAAFVYGDDFIEHLRLEAARTMLREAHRVLKVGGVIRLVTPDVERTARLYLEKGELADAHLERHRDVGYEMVEHYVDLLRVTFSEVGHHLGYLWDFEALAQELCDAGFTDVRRCELGESPCVELRGLEARAGAGVAATTLIVEATA